jgi:organic radical activating enzyme
VPEDVENGVCVDLEISFDINCNAACLSCSGGFSTTWQKYDHKHQLFDYGPIEDHAPRLLDQLISTVPMHHLRQLFILGGEPFYSNTHFKLLKHVEQVHPDLKKIDLWYQTNGSLFPNEEVRKLWTKFKRVVVGFSLDGIGNQFEYLRYPLTWDRLTNTVSRLLEETDVVFNFNSTISPLNVLYFQDIVEWVYDTIPLSRLTWPDAPVRLNQCWYPMNLSLSTTELREACLKKYGENHPVTILFKKMPVGEQQEIFKMFNYIQKHDAIRQLDWRKTFPEVVPFYKNIT